MLKAIQSLLPCYSSFGEHYPKLFELIRRACTKVMKTLVAFQIRHPYHLGIGGWGWSEIDIKILNETVIFWMEISSQIHSICNHRLIVALTDNNPQSTSGTPAVTGVALHLPLPGSIL